MTENNQSSPYSEQQWSQINELGTAVETQLQKLKIGLTMGGEPTFVSLDDYESPQWQIEALGDDKRRLAEELLLRLIKRFPHPGGLLHYGIGKVYGGEPGPRWSLGYYWREDGQPLWGDLKNYGLENIPREKQAIGLEDSKYFSQELAQKLGIDPQKLIPIWKQETNQAEGYILPLLPIRREAQIYWSSCIWNHLGDKLYSLPGDGALGLRLPLNEIHWSEELAEEAIAPLTASPIRPSPEPLDSPPNTIRIALAIEARQGKLFIFMPPLASPRGYIDLITNLENVAETLAIPIILEGYPPPGNAGLDGFQITPDPGVIEVNIHPAKNWQELVDITTILFEEARQCRLGTEKYTLDGRRVSTGGGSHLTIGGKTPLESPLLRRPQLLQSLITYWQHHPSLSFAFAGSFVGPTSQSPRIDEARHDSLYELEIAFQTLQTWDEIPPEVVDRALRHLLVDLTGNTHRTAFCIDKLYPLENLKAQLGLLEFRAFAMPTHAHIQLLLMLLIRAMVAWFWEHPYTHPLIRWGTTLHDRFFLPHYLERDLRQVLGELEKEADFHFQWEWFKPVLDFRFPVYGQVTVEGTGGIPITLELRHAIEPWPVLGEETQSGRTARYVDSSMERLQVKLTGAIGQSPNLDSYSSHYLVLCNGQQVPLKSTGIVGEYVGGVRYRARYYGNILHPAIAPHSPLTFDIVDPRRGGIIGGCTYTVQPEKLSQKFPTNPQEAALRLEERFITHTNFKSGVKIPPLSLNAEYPMVLDLRIVKI